MTQATRLIDALNNTFGRHRGARASHAKGFAAVGRFVPSPVGAAARIPLLATEQPVVARFSIGGGNPGISDKSPTVRGLGLTIGDASEVWSLALISVPVFFANTAQQFVEFLAARVPDPAVGGPNPEKVKAFNLANPNTIPHQEYLKSAAPCRSYSTERYHSGHAYKVSTQQGDVAARILLEPEAGRHGLTDHEKSSAPDDYLHDAMLSALSQGHARWKLTLVLANSGDELHDPTMPWIGRRQEIVVGTLEISALDESTTGQERVFDPTHFPTGVDAPSDEIFSFRSEAYAISKSQRAG